MVLPMLFPVLYSCPVSLEHVLVYLVNYVVVLLSHCVLSIASCRIVVHEQDSTRSILFIVSFILSRLIKFARRLVSLKKLSPENYNVGEKFCNDYPERNNNTPMKRPVSPTLSPKDCAERDVGAANDAAGL